MEQGTQRQDSSQHLSAHLENEVLSTWAIGTVLWFNTIYIIIVHERMDFVFHKGHDPQRLQKRFLIKSHKFPCMKGSSLKEDLDYSLRTGIARMPVAAYQATS